MNLPPVKTIPASANEPDPELPHIPPQRQDIKKTVRKKQNHTISVI